MRLLYSAPLQRRNVVTRWKLNSIISYIYNLHYSWELLACSDSYPSLGYSGPLTDCLRGYPMKNVINQADSISKHSNSSKHYFNYLLLDSKYTKVGCTLYEVFWLIDCELL